MTQYHTDEMPLLDVPLNREADTVTFARALGTLLRPGDVVCLWGDLGAGKSTLARALIQGQMGDDTDAPSPTFTLVQTYEAPDFDIWHFDLYRLEDPSEVLELGIEDAFAEAVSLIEWPDRLGPYMPLERLDVVISHGAGDTRELALYAPASFDARLQPLAGLLS